ncbi:MAG: lactate utilization protein [Bacillota bacterium]
MNEKNMVETLAINLEKNGYIVEVLEKGEDVASVIEKYISKVDKIGNGGSMTIEGLGVFEKLHADGFDVISKREGVDYPTTVELSKNATVFLTSTNAVSVAGEFVNIDGRGNRVSQMAFGAQKIFYVFGENKITADLTSAIDRVRNIASPLNARRLSKNTPCVVDLKCHNCNSPDRICKAMLISDRPTSAQIAHVIIIRDSLGY